MSNCQVCHQTARTGVPPTIPSLVGVVQRIGPNQVQQVLMHGEDSMPSFAGKMTPAQTADLITYLANPNKARQR